ncbi:hypothetical protein IT568_09035 [bacterium]|nr:hypothetical protein [bacterium]
MEILYSFCLQILSKIFLTLPTKNKKLKIWQKIQKQQTHKKTQNSLPKIWFHCASFGEFTRVEPLISELVEDFEIFVTFFSSSGFLVLENFFTEFEGFKNTKNELYLKINFLLLPTDTQKNAKNFIAELLPKLVVWVENDCWFNFAYELKKRKIPQVFLCAKLKNYSSRLKFPAKFFFKKLYSLVDFFGVVDQNSKQNFIKLGVENKKIEIFGDSRLEGLLKEKVTNLPQKWKKLKETQKTAVFGSLHFEDFQALESAFKELQKVFFLVLVPHETQETEFLAKLKKVENSLVVEEFGVLKSLYSVADFIFVGGGFTKNGVHSLWEAKIYEVPVFFGPNHKNSQETTGNDKNFVVKNGKELVEKVQNLSGFKPEKLVLPESVVAKMKKKLLEQAESKIFK